MQLNTETEVAKFLKNITTSNFCCYTNNNHEKKEIKEILKKHKEELRKRFGVREIGLKEYLEEILGVNVDLVSKGGIIKRPLLWNYVKEEIIYI